MTTYTKGPWIPVVADGGHLVVGQDGYAICALPSITRPLEEQHANAELIAMGPDLLYRLTQLANYVRRSDADNVGAEPVDADAFDIALEEAETLLELLAESGITAGEVA